jgi:Ca-activated chloride channel family protein
MKRFLKKNRYEMTDVEKEQVWQGIRRDAKAGGRSSLFGPVSLRPALTAGLTVVTLAVLGVWWIDSNQPDKIQPAHPGLLAESPIPATSADPDAPPQVWEKKEAGTESLEEADLATVRQEKGAPSPAPAEEVARFRSATLPQEAPPAVLSGKIIDPATGQGLPFAIVRIRGTNLSALADSNGVFRFEDLTPGQEMTLVVLMSGYEPFEQTVSVPQQGSLEYALTLDPADPMGTVPVVAAVDKKEIRSREEKDEAGSGRLDQSTPAPETYLRNDAGGTVGKAQLWGEESVSEFGSGGSVTGGTRPPNDEQVELMYFGHVGVNPFVATEEDSLSTFAVDVDNASWTVARNYLSRGVLPPADAIRVEEFVNMFDPGWPRHTDEVFRLHSDGAESRFGDGYHLLRVGVVGKTVADENRKAANLIFVIDISGSMDRENRLGAVKESLRILLNELGEGDRVGLVVYGSRGEIRLEPTDISRREIIMQAIDGLVSNGSTNVYEGLDLAYGLARKHYEPAKVNRLILCSDGVANNGASTEAEKILSLVRKSSDEGITISTIGFGMGNYNDVMMEKLANKGDGNYYYVDQQDEAERVFRENLTGLLQTIAREVKVQVAFDPSVVKRWRLLGYENRDVADRDFRNDAVDAGEVGAGHQVTALYELKLDLSAADAETQAGTIRLRHEAPAHDTVKAGQVEEIERPILLGSLTGEFAGGNVWLRTQAVAAEFAEILRESYWAKESRLADLVPVADGLAAEMPGDPAVRDLADMIRQAADLQDASVPDKQD